MMSRRKYGKGNLTLQWHKLIHFVCANWIDNTVIVCSMMRNAARVVIIKLPQLSVAYRIFGHLVFVSRLLTLAVLS